MKVTARKRVMPVTTLWKVPNMIPHHQWSLEHLTARLPRKMKERIQ